VTWVRQFFRWDVVESHQGDYRWEQYDGIVSALNQHPDLRLVAVLMHSPQWSRSSGQSTAPPDDPADFARFAGAFAERYANSIDYYQIWDEPNLTEAWGESDPRPSAYAALLQGAYTSIHRADPTATVIAAALAPTVEQGPHNLSDLRYLSDLYALGAKDFMDVVAAKPYGFDSPPDDRLVAEDHLNFSRIVALREIMLANGDGKTALWAANWGWNSLPADWSGPPSIWGSTDSNTRVQDTLLALDRAEREWPWLGAMIMQHWQPQVPPDDPLWGFAVIDASGQPTALWQALVNRPAHSGALDGLYPVTNPYARYSGVWTFSSLGADIGWVNDSRFEFDFQGQDVALLLNEDNYVAYLYPTVDGQQANAVPTDPAGNAYIVLTSNTREPKQTLVSVSQGLRPGPHTLRVTADDLVPDDTVDRWALVGYAVSSGSLRDAFDRQIAVAWFSTGIGLLAAIITGAQLSWGKFLRPMLRVWQNLSSARQLAVSAATSLALMIGMLLTWGDATPAIFRRESVQLGLAVVTAGVIYVQPGLILTLAAALILFVILFNRVDLGLILTIFWAPFFLFPVELFVFSFPMSEVLILITAAAWLLRLFSDFGRARRQVSLGWAFRVRFSAMDWAVLAWVGLGMLSISWAELRPQAITELRTLILEPALFYLIFRRTARSSHSQLMITVSLWLAGLVVSVIGLWMFFQGESIITAEAGVHRLASVYGSPNNLGLFLGRCLPFALAYLLSSVDRTRRGVAVAAFLAMAAAVLLSQSAGALLIGVPVAGASVLLLIWRRRALRPLAGVLALGTAALALALQSARFARLLDFTSGTNFARIRVWNSALNAIREHPITGLGLDQFLYAFRSRYILPDAWQEPDLSHPHNFLLDFWVRLGIFGVAVFAWIQVVFWIQAARFYQQLRSEHNPIYFALVVGVMGSMINLLSHGLVDNSVFVNDLAYGFVLLLGVIANGPNARAIDGETKKMV
ncbi:MAG: O-antigen ligase family protein, partial [Anaerolineae bacterium]|nr:O-antigen ligase family protein [Anaerolineae bacterium]